MQVPNATSSFDNNAGSPTSTSVGGSGAASPFQSLLAQLTDYVNETPAQRMKASILAQLGITPQQLKDMPPKERAAVEAKVQDLLKKEIQAQQRQV